MNRFKLISVLILLTVVGILLGQNRQLLPLKFLCPDLTRQDCLYQTASLPLAAWIAIFAIAGTISSLVWQFLSQVATPQKNTTSSQKSDNRRSQRDPLRGGRSTESSSRSPKQRLRNSQPEYTRKQTDVKTNDFPKTDWEQPVSEDWESADTVKDTSTGFQTTNKVNLEKEKVRDTVNRNTAYSYSFRESDRQQNESSSDESKQVAQKNSTDDVYDASYRTVSSPQQKTSNVYEDDEEWI